MTLYAIAHAPKGASFVVTGDSEKPECVRLKDNPADPPKARSKATFLEKISAGDVVVLEMGGAADRLALAAMAYGAHVKRYPSFRLNKTVCEEIVKSCGYRFREEKPRAGETGELLTARKMRGYALFGLEATGDPGFYEVTARDVQLMRLGLAFRSYMRSYKATMRSYQGLLAAYRDQAFVELALARQLKADALAENIHSFVIERLAEDMLGGEISDTERQDFFALIGKEFEGGVLPDRADEATVSRIVEILLDSDRFRATVFGRLKSQKTRIEKMLTGGRIGRKGEAFEPNEIYQKVFEPIPGCGPLIAARFISSIGDIRRFVGHDPAQQPRVNEIVAERHRLLTEAGYVDAKKEIAFTEAELGNRLFRFGRVAKHFHEKGDELQHELMREAMRLTMELGKIRRTEKERDLARFIAYAGYHHFEDGSRARRRAGKVSNWNTQLKQAVYLLCDMTVKNPTSPWRAMLDQRKAYELVKLLADRQAKADEQGLEVEILPAAFRRPITSVADVTLADFTTLSEHIKQLQERAGVAWKGVEAEFSVAHRPRTTRTRRRARRRSRTRASASWCAGSRAPPTRRACAGSVSSSSGTSGTRGARRSGSRIPPRRSTPRRRRRRPPALRSLRRSRPMPRRPRSDP